MVCVRSISQPMITGLRNDPSPIMLVIAPKPPAAAEPASNFVGMDQNGPVKENVVQAIKVNSI
jgi:hypothetical protein